MDDDADDDRPRTPIITGPIIELRGREVLFAISVFFLTAIVVGLIVVLASNKVKEIGEEQVSQAEKCEEERQLEDELEHFKAEASRYCLTTDCVLETSAVLRRMDLSVNPCDDFWKYSCGGWLDVNQDKLVDRESWGIEDEAEASVRRYIRRMLDGPAECEDEVMTTDCKMRLMYARCMDTDAVDAAGARPLQDILDRFGGWSALDDWNIGVKSGRWQTQRIMQDLQYNYSVDTFFTINVIPDEHADNTSIIQIVPLDPSRLGLGGLDYYSYNETHPRVLAYKIYMATIAQLLNVTQTDTENLVQNTLALERRLAQMQEDPVEDVQSRECRFLVGDLERISGLIKWRWYLGNMSDANIIKPDTPVLVCDNKYLSDVSRLLATTDEVDINGYMVWRLISQLAAPLLSQPFSDAYQAYHQVEGTSIFSDRAAFCQSVVNEYFGKAVSASIMKEYLNNDTRAAVDEMIENIKNVVSRTLSASHWMDDDSSAAAIDKLNALQFRYVGSPPESQTDNETEEVDVIEDFYDSFHVDMNSSFFDIVLNGLRHRHRMQVEALVLPTDDYIWSVDAHDVKAFYSRTRNTIGITAGILQPPYFDVNSKAFFNYGALGSTIAREMTLAFDEKGSEYAKNGSLATWWTDDTWDKFRTETYCFVEVYSQHKVKCISVDEELTLESNIADVGGLRIAYKAYKDWTLTNSELQLPNKNMTIQQFFFIAFAQKYCTKRTTQSQKTFLRTSETSLEEIRVKGAVSVLKEFAEAFSCPFDSKMRPRKSCHIW